MDYKKGSSATVLATHAVLPLAVALAVSAPLAAATLFVRLLQETTGVHALNAS